MRASFYIALLVAFIDNMGVGLIYPLFSSMLFDSSLEILPAQTSPEMRGFWLGLLIALMPISQFFSAPIWGALSDRKGRKSPLRISLAIACLGYLTALAGVMLNNIILLLASRIIVGSASGNISIVQAAIADMSKPEEKAKNFGLYGMALGVGFTLGPFFGGMLSSWGYNIPFIFAALTTALNLVFAMFFFKETNALRLAQSIHWDTGLSHLKKAFSFKGLRTILLTSFLHNFAWSFFYEFAPVYLISAFSFSPVQIGTFYAVAGANYALSTGLMLRPLSRFLKPQMLYFAGNLLTALAILAMPSISSALGIWLLMAFICYFVALVAPTSTTLISNGVSSQVQGEALGMLSSVNAIALGISPLFSGSLVGAHPTLPMSVGGLAMLAAAFIVLAVFRTRLFSRESVKID